MKWHNPLALVSKKGIALQAGWQSLVGATPVLGKSGADAIASPAGQALPMVMPMPSAGQVGIGAQGTFSDVAE